MRGLGIKNTKKKIGVDSYDWIPGQARDDKLQALDDNTQVRDDNTQVRDDNTRVRYQTSLLKATVV